MTALKNDSYSIALAQFLKNKEGNSSMVYLDASGYPTIGIGTLLYQKGVFQDKAVNVVAQESSDPVLFKKIMDVISAAKGNIAELNKLFVTGYDSAGNTTYLS